MLDKAISLAASKFEGKFDKGGNPYILHCLHVMYKVRHHGEDYMIVGVLHDIIEDTETSPEELLNLGFSKEVVEAIVIMTHCEDEPYDEYIKLIKSNPIATEVKLADLKHNSDITRMKGLRDKDFKRLEKYHRAFDYLKY